MIPRYTKMINRRSFAKDSVQLNYLTGGRSGGVSVLKPCCPKLLCQHKPRRVASILVKVLY